MMGLARGSGMKATRDCPLREMDQWEMAWSRQRDELRMAGSQSGPLTAVSVGSCNGDTHDADKTLAAVRGSRACNVTAMHDRVATALPATGGTIALGDITNVAAYVKSGAVAGVGTADKKMAGLTQRKRAGADDGRNIELAAGGGGQAATPTNVSGSMVITVGGVPLFKDGYATGGDMVQHGGAGFNFEGAANGQAAGAPLTYGVDVRMCPVKGLGKPCCTSATAGSAYDSVPDFTNDTSGVGVATGPEVDEPGEFGLVTMMAACPGAAPRDGGDDKHVAVFYNGQEPAIHCAMEALLIVLSYSNRARRAGGALRRKLPEGLMLTDLIPTAAARGSQGGPGDAGGGRGDG